MILFKKNISLICFAAILMVSCSEKVPESTNNLCSGYWLESSGNIPHLVKFTDEGDLFRYVYRYEESENRYYCYYDEAANGEYMLDIENSMLCMLPDAWYDIYVLTGSSLVLHGSGEEMSKFGKVVNDKVRVLSKPDFNSKYP